MSQQTECRRCGGCCLGGGPALHQEDLPLFDSGVLHTGALLTLRRGEPAFDQPANMVAPLPEEILKLAYAEDASSCLHYQPDAQACAIYEHRPHECRLQACWDDSALRASYHKGRITRHHLLSPDSAAAALARMHEEQCSFEALARAAAEFLESPCAGTEGAVLEILERDAAIRAGLARRLEQPEMAIQGYCLFLFGRPMRQSLAFYGLRLASEQGRVRLLRWRAANFTVGQAAPPDAPGTTDAPDAAGT